MLRRSLEALTAVGLALAPVAVASPASADDERLCPPLGECVILAAAPTDSPSPEQLAREALPLESPPIGLSLKSELSADGIPTGTVGVDLWLWTDPTPRVWGPLTRRWRTPGMEWVATAHVLRVYWIMGDRGFVTCDVAGTPHVFPATGPSPDCGYRFQIGGLYQVTATAVWHVDWSDAVGEVSGSFITTVSNTAVLRIREARLLYVGGVFE
jgi:hypothetical protein